MSPRQVKLSDRMTFTKSPSILASYRQARNRMRSTGIRVLQRLAGVMMILTALTSCSVAQRQGRTLEEIKVEAIHRAEVGAYPLIGLDPNDVREAFQHIHSRDKDEWAQGFMDVAAR